MTPFDLILNSFSLELTAVRIRAIFEVSSLNLSRGTKGVSKFQKWVTWHPHMNPFTLFCIFSVRTHCHPSPCQIWSF